MYAYENEGTHTHNTHAHAHTCMRYQHYLQTYDGDGNGIVDRPQACVCCLLAFGYVCGLSLYNHFTLKFHSK